MNATSDEIALLANIVANPADDTARLVYADCLDESGDERVTCPQCDEGVYKSHAGSQKKYKCTNCKGAGTIIDTSRTDRAAFIRCQIELASHYISDARICNAGPMRPYIHGGYLCTACRPPCADCMEHKLRRNEFRARESELLARNHPRWLPICHCNYRDGGFVYDGLGAEDCPSCGGSGRAGEMCRGFLERVEVPMLASVFGRCCGLCDGTGKFGGYECDRCEGDGKASGIDSDDGWKPTDFARTLFRGEHATVQAIVVRDREPSPAAIAYPDGPSGHFGWWADPDDDLGILDPSPEQLPRFLWDKLPPGKTHRLTGSYWKWYESAEAAKQALALVLTDTLRALCGGET